MKLAKVVGHVSGIPIWEYTRGNFTFWVREFNHSKEGKHSYIIKGPSGKLYFFSECDADILKLLTFIEEGRAEGEHFSCSLNSIYDES